ncbi:MAG TPA: tetratricopeptide repeat protein [Anaeromyxobacter sp.]|nr:tetratricopeptide repeat protein [Anaeromyxobacter sp.]
MVAFFLFAALAAPAAEPGPGGSGTPSRAQPAAGEHAQGAPSAPLAQVDVEWPRRDQPGVIDDMRAKLTAAEKAAPGDYEVLWRQARHYFWLADDPNLEKSEKSRLGKIAWDYGDRATQANPNRVEGWNYAAAGMGNYALGIGILTALRQGIEGKFKERLSRAEQIDAKFENGAIQTAWGRFWYELPWPKYSARRSREALERAIQQNPDNVRAHVYLADLWLKEDEPAKARAELDKAVANAPGRYDPPEERRWQAVARKTRDAAKKSESAAANKGESP